MLFWSPWATGTCWGFDTRQLFTDSVVLLSFVWTRTVAASLGAGGTALLPSTAFPWPRVAAQALGLNTEGAGMF